MPVLKPTKKNTTSSKDLTVEMTMDSIFVQKPKSKISKSVKVSKNIEKKKNVKLKIAKMKSTIVEETKLEVFDVVKIEKVDVLKIDKLSTEDNLKKYDQEVKAEFELQKENTRIAKAEKYQASTKLQRVKNWLSETGANMLNLNPFRKNPDKEMQKEYLFYYNQQKARKMENNIISCIAEKELEIMVNGVYSRIYHLSEIPDQFYSSFVLQIMNSGLPLSLDYHIKGTNKAKYLPIIRRRRTILIGQQDERRNRGSDLDPYKEKEILEIERLIENMINGGQKSFLVGITATISAESSEKLKEYCTKFENLTKQLEMIFRPNIFRQKASLPTVMPFANNTVKENTNLQTEVVVEMFPFLAKNIQDDNGFFLGSSLTNKNSMIIIDPFAPHVANSNILILGVSGSGKSVTSKSLLIKLVMKQTQCIILDPEGEYVKVTDKLKGENILFGVDENGVNRGLNIFNLEFVSDESRRNHISVLKNFFQFTIDSNKYSDSELDALLTKFYNTGNDQKEKSNLTMQRFVDLAKTEKLSFHKDLLKLTEGSLKGLFDSDEQLDFKNGVINFNLSKLGEERLKLSAMYLIGSIVDNLIDRDDKKRMIFIDEAHLFLNREFTREFYIRLQKTARKRKAGVISITQNAEDFREDGGAKTILTQAETTILLRQHPASVNFLKRMEIFDLNDSEYNELASLDKGEAILFREKEHMLIKITPFQSEWEFLET